MYNLMTIENHVELYELAEAIRLHSVALHNAAGEPPGVIEAVDSLAERINHLCDDAHG